LAENIFFFQFSSMREERIKGNPFALFLPPFELFKLRLHTSNWEVPLILSLGSMRVAMVGTSKERLTVQLLFGLIARKQLRKREHVFRDRMFTILFVITWFDVRFS
jgi:hypothetical protein